MVTLATNRLVLREFTQEDFTAVQKYASNPNVVRYMLWGPNTEDETRRFLQHAIKCQIVKPRTAFELAITHNEVLIGGAGSNVRDTENREAEIGYCLDEPYWGKGFGTELAEALIRYSFEVLKIHRVVARCDSDNVGSYRVMEKNGMKREGLLRENLVVKGKRRDTLIYSILSHEWSQDNQKILL